MAWVRGSFWLQPWGRAPLFSRLMPEARLTQYRGLAFGKSGRVIAPRKKMAVGVERDGDRAVPQALADDLGRQL